MQEEINEKSIALTIRATKLTAEILKKTIGKLLIEMGKKVHSPKMYQGKQSVKDLIGQGAGISNIEMADSGLKDFERIAKKYGVDYAVKKDKSLSPPKYLLFFKSRDTDAMTAAFQEFTQKQVKQKAKPSLLKKLKQNINQLKQTNREVNKHRQREESR